MAFEFDHLFICTDIGAFEADRLSPSRTLLHGQGLSNPKSKIQNEMSIPVIDPFGVTHDLKMPSLARALDPREVQHQLQHCCPDLTRENHPIHLCAIRVTRYKPGRRCLIEYDLEGQHPLQTITLVGKVRSRGLDQSSYHLLQSLWNADFAPNSADGIAVPEPVGVIPQFQMWLQRKVPGASATELLVKSGGTTLARRIATAVHKLHQAGIPSHRRHTMADELRILHERLPLVAQIKPQWTGRLEKLLEACNQLGAATPTPNFRGIHRDFYPDQVIVDGERLYFLDFDLYCQGDPGLDIGNFLGHLKEQSLRTLGDSEALADRETALTEQFVQLSGETTEVAISAYTMLTLVRHVYLSTQFSERRQFTEALLELCEQRLMS